MCRKHKRFKESLILISENAICSLEAYLLALLKASSYSSTSVFTETNKTLLQCRRTDMENEIALDFCLKHAS